MNAWECLPHRWLINKSLRKSSDELRTKIDACQVEYDRRVEACKIELEQEEEKKNRELDEFRLALNLQLQNDRVLLDEMCDDVTQYVDKYLYGKYIGKFLGAKSCLDRVLKEEEKILSNQMSSIGYEIENLEQRKTVLSSFADVHDVVELMELSGYEIQVDSITDAATLLKNINLILSKYGGKQEAEAFALRRLKNIVQQRTDYFYMIQYIDWVIQQKTIFSKQLSIKRDGIRKKMNELSAEIKEMVVAKRTLEHKLMGLAKRVRMRWTKPITYLNADIAFLSKGKSEKIQEIEDKKRKRGNIGTKLHAMSEFHVNDQIRWNRLQREREKLSSEIDKLNSDIKYLSRKIDNARKEKIEWNNRKKEICDLIINHTGFFEYEKKISNREEYEIIESRLAEINKIREDEKKSAEQKCDEERAGIEANYEHIKKKYTEDKNMMSEQLLRARIEQSKAEIQVQNANMYLGKCQENDKRPRPIRWLFETPEVKIARKKVKMEEQSFTKAKAIVNNYESKIENINSKLESEEHDYEQRIGLCVPHYLRPTADEKLEEKKLMLRMDELKNQRT